MKYNFPGGLPKRYPTRTATTGRTFLMTVMSASVLGLSLFSSCKKDDAEVQKVGTTTMTPAESKALEARIQAFYAKVKALHNGAAAKGTEAELMSPEDAEFLTEATYNYYVARHSDDMVQSYAVKVEEPMTDGKIDMADVSDAFYALKAAIMTVYNSVNYTDKGLESFDLQVKVENGQAVFYAMGNIKSGGPLGGPDVAMISNIKTLNTPATRGYRAFSAMSPFLSTPVIIPGSNGLTAYYGKGQVDLNFANHTTSNYDATKPDGANILRSLGLGNYHETYGYYALAYGQLITNVQFAPLAPTPLTAPLPSPYNNIDGWDNSDILKVTRFFDATGNSNDIDVNIKAYMNTTMMNYYLSFIPAKINAALPGYRVVYDLNILFHSSTTPNILHDGAFNNRYYETQLVQYYLSYGTITGIPLSPPYPYDSF